MACTSAPRSHGRRTPNEPWRRLVSSDGFVKVWDLGNRTLVQELFIGSVEVQSVAFLGEDRLAVVPSTGGIRLYTLDVDVLGDLVRMSSSRGFTPAECQKYFIDSECPSVEDLRRSRPSP